jgi:hypothetical protein
MEKVQYLNLLFYLKILKTNLIEKEKKGKMISVV